MNSAYHYPSRSLLSVIADKSRYTSSQQIINDQVKSKFSHYLVEDESFRTGLASRVDESFITDRSPSTKIIGLVDTRTRQRLIGKWCNTMIGEYDKETRAYDALQAVNCPRILQILERHKFTREGLIILPQHKQFEEKIYFQYPKRCLYHLLQALAALHSIHYIHVDVTEYNIVWELNEQQEPNFFLIDFGEAKEIVNCTDFADFAAEDVGAAGILFGRLLLRDMFALSGPYPKHIVLIKAAAKKQIKLDEDAIDLFLQLTNVDKNKRMTASQALNHRYFASERGYVGQANNDEKKDLDAAFRKKQ